MDDDLFGFVAGALERGENEAIATMIHASAVLQKRTTLLRRAFTFLECDRAHFPAPFGLAEHTCERVELLRSQA